MLRTRVLTLTAAMAATACGSSSDYAKLYAHEPLAPSIPQSDVEALNTLGATLVDKGVNFSVYSENAERIDLLLFDDPETELPTRQIEMTRFGSVFNVYVQGVGLGQHYGYVAWGPNWTYDEDFVPGTVEGFVTDVDSQGNRFNPNKLLLDPYAKIIHRDHDWSKGSAASGPSRHVSTWAAASKAIVGRSTYEWSDHEAQWIEARKRGETHGYNDLIVYEVHLKGFTKDPSSGVEHPGTYRGFGEKAAYLAELGVTAVELLPINEKPVDGGYWGYQTLGFFLPENTYGNPTPLQPQDTIDEFKWMVDQLHQHGIEVFLDVVYNHTGEGGLWRSKIELSEYNPLGGADIATLDEEEVATLLSYRGLDNAAYYALSEDGRSYWNNTGVGNQTRCNHTPMRRLIIDSLRYWVEEMHVDGFRFDLAPVLGAADDNHNAWADPATTVLQDIMNDPVLREHHTRIIAEPWAAGGDYGWRLGAFPSGEDLSTGWAFGWGEWNAHFRDWWRSFLNEGYKLTEPYNEVLSGGFVLTGSQDYFAHNNRRPYHSVNFVTAHDGFTLYDLFTYDQKRNDCSPLNPVCCDAPLSAWCDKDSGENHNRSRDLGSDNEHLKRQAMRNMFVAMLISHGTPMLLGGDEWMRTQLGNNNAYSTGADNEFNWFAWGTWQAKEDRHRMFDFVKEMNAFRREHLYALSPREYGAVPFAWKRADNQDMGDADWNNRHLAIHYWDGTVGPELYILINFEAGDVAFQLPTGRSWHRVVDTQTWFDSEDYFQSSGADRKRSANIERVAPEPITDADYTVKPESIVILEDRS